MSNDSLKFHLYVTCDNAAFEESVPAELARILRNVATRLERGEDCGSFRSILDVNGNVVGSFALKSESAMRSGRIYERKS